MAPGRCALFAQVCRSHVADDRAGQSSVGGHRQRMVLRFRTGLHGDTVDTRLVGRDGDDHIFVQPNKQGPVDFAEINAGHGDGAPHR